MTIREQTKINIFNGLPLDTDTSALYALVDEICDKYDSRTCDNCEWGKQLDSGPYCELMSIFDMEYCSKFVTTDAK